MSLLRPNRRFTLLGAFREILGKRSLMLGMATILLPDRHLTTVVTPFGRLRYCRAPQGFVSSGDGFNRRFDAILSDFERKERCVDDTAH